MIKYHIGHGELSIAISDLLIEPMIGYESQMASIFQIGIALDCFSLGLNIQLSLPP